MAEALQASLEQTGRMDVVGVAGSLAQALALDRDVVPDLILLDLRLKAGTSALGAIEEMVRARPDARIVVYTASEDVETARRALAAGAAGYVRKSSSAEDLVACIDAVMAGQREVLDHETAADLWRASRSPEQRSRGRQGPPSTEPLTAREEELVSLMAAEGVITTAEIAERLSISRHTVRAHLTSIFAKLRVNSRAQVVRYVYSRDQQDRR